MGDVPLHRLPDGLLVAHLNMHASNGLDFGGLLLIDYTFHLPLGVAGVALALSFISLMKNRTVEESAAPGEETPALAK